jgi:2-phospho-L-lactate guanylyltransferase
MALLVPLDATTPKSRLSPFLTADERREFATAMAADVVSALAATGRNPTVLATAETDLATDAAHEVAVDDRPLTDAVNARLETNGPVAVVMADLALATPAALDRLFDSDGDVVLAPGRGGGTNALVARHPEFRVDYHGASIRDHREVAADLGASVAEVDSFRLATDVDERADLAEVLLHAEGRAADWLVDAGVELAVTDGRVGVERPES